MKFLHISDLHIGKRVNGFSMIDDQQHILKQIIEITKEEQPDVVLIAGDVYDKPDPSNEAVALYDHFLFELADTKTTICMISGNHDSAHLLSCGGRLMEKNNVYISPVYHGQIDPITIADQGTGKINIWLIPFVKPTNVRKYNPDAEITDYTTAMQCIIESLNVDREDINIVVSHQFITGASRSDSEESVGGLDQVDVSVFDAFDYVALGHLHGPQKVGRDTVRYAGSPLKYSFSEMKQKKSVTIIEINTKEDILVRQIPLVSKRQMVEIRGRFEELISKETQNRYDKEDYYHIVLTDEQDIPNAATRLRTFYPNWMVFDYDNTRTRTQNIIHGAVNVKERSSMDLFEELFEKQMGHGMNDSQKCYMKELMKELQEG